MKLSNYRYNRLGGVDADRELESGETVPTTLTDEEIAELPGGVEIADYAEPSSVPQVVTMRQARLALLQSNLLHLVDPAIDALPEPDKSAARIEWEYSQTVVRDRPFVQMLGAALGLSDEQIDDLFQLAATL